MKKYILLLLLQLTVISVFSQKKIKVACVGNSVTYGYLLPDREKNAYPSQLQMLLGDSYEVRNFGKSGATLLSKGHLPYNQQPEYKAALDFSGDLVVIHLGLNDTDPRNWPNYRDEFIKDYTELIRSFRKVNPSCKIWICKMTPIFDRHWRFRSGTRDWHGKIQKTIETIAAGNQVGLIDLEPALHQRPDLFPDALHPDKEGAEILAHTVYSALTGNYGGLRMPQIYSDSMVLQRNQPLTIRGTANAGEKITVKIGKQKHTTLTEPNGQWQVTLDPLATGNTYTLTVSAPSRTLTFNQVVAGEVWLCSGQSNMAFMVKQSVTAKEDIAGAAQSQVRLFNLKLRWETYAVQWPANVLDSLNRLQYYHSARWTSSTPKTVADFSAVAYHFGKILADSLQVPVGLICNAVGGSPCEAWIDRRTLEYEFPDILVDWKNNDMIQSWVRSRAALNVKKSGNKFQRHPYEPCYLYEAGITPLSRYPIKGIIWYQGESNAHNMEIHETLFPLLVNSWRKNWDDAKMPFYYVQLSSINRPSWPWFRDSQRRMQEKIPYSGMAVSSDLGDSLDVHPRHKKEIGQRLAFRALHDTYQKKTIPSGPLYRSVHFKNKTAYVLFDYAEGMHTSDGKSLRTFEIAGPDGLFYPAKAEIKGNQIKVSAKEVSRPSAVRYGWQPFTRANLVNAAGLPASTFRTDTDKE